MDKIKHTPGPWNCTRASSSGYDVIQAENAPVDVCVVSRRDKSGEEINANARLIAAAPDLLIALELIAADADAGNSRLTSGVRLALDAALIKAGRKAAPEPVRHITVAGVDR
ncbi:hypothetical protein [Burkholderia cenocepacia]|jgi:hypothetical protein|uniref:hypothetical protein n=1 Tax=Burkholderia cenocepacia TaxID=95486 RepID=UPI0026523ADD|nr:hypothetical protein [Burkholderia cenocepacia]MDN7658472.1 hypothetical protein [Burkholderia cenocepacia]